MMSMLLLMVQINLKHYLCCKGVFYVIEYIAGQQIAPNGYPFSAKTLVPEQRCAVKSMLVSIGL
jgi:hypothetical protein